MAKRPSFFLSSTIHDFRDLRSALKFALEQRGCQVFASEFNDFRAELDRHSYDACLTNIEQADFFVLLIGGRVGGWFNEAERISITQQEYRTAYERHKAGTLKILAFVRAEVWQVREDRKELERHLRSLDLEDRERVEIASYPSKFANNAAFIGDFIGEVGRNAETLRAVKGGGALPTGNWVHTFSDFRDIHDVLAPLIFSGTTADEAAYSSALEHELLTLLARFLVKIDGNPIDVRGFISRHLKTWPITLTDRDQDFIIVDNKSWQSFSSLLIHVLAQHPTLVVIQDALTSSLFMTYRRDSGTYEQSLAYDGLAKLIGEVRRFKNEATAETMSVIYEYSPKRIGRPVNVSLPVLRLASLYSVAQRWVNIVGLSKALALHLQGKPYVEPALQPFSPIDGMSDKIDAETVSVGEAREFLARSI
ncbi:MAG: DUF4062 domain-containing protein [Alphaproteobacteria bacterium]|nr:MAG: DUF4062 domain-containing protein [Alphaproteobacteria bacterium]